MPETSTSILIRIMDELYAEKFATSILDYSKFIPNFPFRLKYQEPASKIPKRWRTHNRV